MSVCAIVPAAGAGRRFGSRTRKPYAVLRGAPLLAHTLRALQASPDIRWIIPVVRPGEQAKVAALLRRHRITKALPPRAGGASRADSVARGFAAVPAAAEWVLVHDGARPCLSRAVIRQTVREAKRHGAAASGVRAAVTVKAADDARRVRVTLDREHLWFVQTPQVFRRDWFAEALRRVNGRFGEFPDDAAMVESAGFGVRMVAGDPLNLKVTTKEDLMLAEAILRSRNGHAA